MTLFTAWSEIVADWDASFPQRRTLRRAMRQAHAYPNVPGCPDKAVRQRNTITN